MNNRIKILRVAARGHLEAFVPAAPMPKPAVPPPKTAAPDPNEAARSALRADLGLLYAPDELERVIRDGGTDFNECCDYIEALLRGETPKPFPSPARQSLSPFQAAIFEELKSTFTDGALTEALKNCEITEDSFDDSVAAVLAWVADHQRPDGPLDIRVPKAVPPPPRPPPATTMGKSRLKFILPDGKTVELMFPNERALDQMADRVSEDGHLDRSTGRQDLRADARGPDWP
jgi:hypothetical protein